MVSVRSSWLQSVMLGSLSMPSLNNRRPPSAAQLKCMRCEQKIAIRESKDRPLPCHRCWLHHSLSLTRTDGGLAAVPLASCKLLMCFMSTEQRQL